MDDDISASVDAFANRKIYTRLDPAILRSINDGDVEQAVVDYVIAKLDGQYEREQQILKTLAPGIRSLYLTWVVEAEVNNGGFNQYYFNTEGNSAAAAAEAFEFFGATQHASLMKEANAIRSREAAEMSRFKHAGTVEAFSESYKHTQLGPLDDRFYKLTENLRELRVARIRQTPELFTGE